MNRSASNTADRMERIFSDLIDRDVWQGGQSRSGTGSDLSQTDRIRAALPELLRRYGIRTMLDVPCGDFNWMQHVELPVARYIGADVLPALIEANEANFARGGPPVTHFERMDLTLGPLPQVDLVLCRDCLVHFSYDDIRASLRQIKASGSKYLLTTVFTASTFNRDIPTGAWRQLNLMLPPFSLPQPLETINEGCTEAAGKYADKSLGLWRVEAITANG